MSQLAYKPRAAKVKESKRLEVYPYHEDAERYVVDVLAERIPACKWVRLACDRHRRDTISIADPQFPYTFDAAKANKVCAFIEKLPHVKGQWARGKTMQTIRLELWQRFILCMIFGWVRKSNGNRRFHKARIYVPRKNGKSVLGAGIGLYMLGKDGEPGAEVYSGATSEKQAMEVFTPARQMALRHPQLAPGLGLTVNAQNLVKESDNSKFVPVIGKPGDGASPHCAIIDEYHEHKTSELIDTMETGMHAREQPLSLVISTAGSNISGPCREDWKACERILENAQGFEDDNTFAIIYTIDQGDQWDTEESLCKANPNWGISINRETMLAELKSAQQSARKQSAFKTKHLNLWVTAKDGFFNLSEWEALSRQIVREDFKENECFLAGDLASKHDLVALMQLFCLPDNRYAVFGKYYLPAAALELPENQHYRSWHRDGFLEIAGDEVTDLDEFAAETLRLCGEYKVREMPSDPNRAWGVFPELQKRGVPIVEYRNTVLFMSEPMKELDSLIRSGRIIHDGNPILAWAISNTCGTIDAKDNVYPRRESPAQKIDPVVALIMAVGRAMLTRNKPQGRMFVW